MAPGSPLKKRLKVTTELLADEEKLRSRCRCWSALPADLLLVIFLRLGSKDRAVLRSVCKRWYLFHIPPPLCFFSSIYNSPRLMITNREDGLSQFIHPISNNHHSLRFPQLIGVKILFYNSEWLLVCSSSSHDATMFFFNPFSREKLKVPPYTATSAPSFVSLSSTQTLVCGSFSSPPTHPDCFLSLVYGTPTLGMIGHATLHFGRGDKYWYYSSFEHLTSDIIFTSFPILSGRDIYCMNKDGDVFIIDLKRYSNWFYNGPESYGYIKYAPPAGKKVKRCYMLEAEVTKDDTKEIEDEEIEDFQGEKVEEYPHEQDVDGYEIYDYFIDRGHLVHDTEVECLNHVEFLAVFVLADIDDDGRQCVLVKKLEHGIAGLSYIWKSVDNLGSKCLYVGDNGSFLVEAGKGRGEANTIYFNYLDAENKVVSYSLSTEGNFINCSCELARKGTWIKPLD